MIRVQIKRHISWRDTRQQPIDEAEAIEWAKELERRGFTVRVIAERVIYPTPEGQT